MVGSIPMSYNGCRKSIRHNVGCVGRVLFPRIFYFVENKIFLSEIRKIEELLGVGGIICRKPTLAEIAGHQARVLNSGSSGIEPLFSEVYTRKFYMSADSFLDHFKCRTHRALNCEALDCKEIASLKWMLARISACADECLAGKEHAGLRGCYDMAQEALNRKYQND